jgi:hypothetical protein
MVCACSGSAANNNVVQNVTVSVMPAAPTVNIFGTQQFAANVTGSSNTAVTWEVNGVAGGSQATGFISSTGLFEAPSDVPTMSDGKGGVNLTTVTVTAVSKANATASGSTTVTIQAHTNQAAQAGTVALGTSGGNVNDISGNSCCSGTLGSLVTRGGTQYILSNNHVLAKSDFGNAGGPPNGDAIIQPGRVDTTPTCSTTGTQTVAHLSEFYNLQTGSLPKIDAAIAQVVNGAVDPNGNILLLGATQTNGVPDPGAPHAGSGVSATLGMAVAKSGRTTGLTCSSVLMTNVSSTVDYTQNCDGTGTKFTVTYTDLVVVQGGGFSAAGDSGALIVTQSTTDAVALLFGGNDQDAVGNAIGDVLGFFTSNGGSATTFVGSAAPHAVIGCTLPTKPASAVQTFSAPKLDAATLQKAITVRDAHGPELMAHPEVQALGVGSSYDNPAEPAILFFVTKGQPHADIPADVDGVRTRIVAGDLFAEGGMLSAEQSAELEKSAAAPQSVYSISQAEVDRVKAVETAHSAELLKKAGVQAVGITSSLDSPGEGALMIYFIRGVAHDSIPPVIDGVRTRIREGSRFRAGLGGRSSQPACKIPPSKAAKLVNAAVAHLEQ